MSFNTNDSQLIHMYFQTTGPNLLCKIKGIGTREIVMPINRPDSL